MQSSARPSCNVKHIRGAIAKSGSSLLPRVLVVDDDPVLALSTAEALARAGFEADTAADGQAGWDALQESTYDLLVTDNNMPRLSGIELLKKLRSEHNEVPAILVSGEMPTEELKRNPWLRVGATLAKPFRGEQLIEMAVTVLCGGDRTLPGNTVNRSFSSEVSGFIITR